MQFGRRYWVIASTGVLLALLALVFDRPPLLLGTASIGGWVVARQFMFVRELARVRRQLVVKHELAQQSVYTDEPVPVVLSMSLQGETALELEAESRPPITATGSTPAERTVERDHHGTSVVEFPIAGEFTFDRPLVTAVDPHGLFAEQFPHGFGPRISVEPRTPRNIHVGQGGIQIATAYGEHEARRHGAGLDPVELREYTTGDAAHRIDWKATARFGEPFVREFEAETDQQTVLLVDHRASTGIGRAGETPLAYLTQVALAYSNTARRLNDPLALYGVGDEGLTTQIDAGSGTDHYRRVRRRLLGLSPTTAVASEETATQSPAAAHRAAERLQNDTTAFATTLRPFFTATGQYVQRIERDPLVATVQSSLARIRGNALTIMFTDDTNRVEVIEAIKLARRGDEHVLVFLTPTVLFEPGALADLESAYERYLDFEEFRRHVAGLARVTVFEVGPGDRVDAILGSRQRRQPSTL